MNVHKGQFNLKIITQKVNALHKDETKRRITTLAVTNVLKYYTARRTGRTVVNQSQFEPIHYTT